MLVKEILSKGSRNGRNTRQELTYQVSVLEVHMEVRSCDVTTMGKLNGDS